MILKYGTYEHTYDGLPTIKVDGPIGEVSFVETWTISGTFRRESKPNRGNHRGRYYRRLNAR